MKNISLLALLLCAVIGPLQAEEQSATESEDHFWLEPGLSYGKPTVSGGLDMRYNFSDYTVALGAISRFDDSGDIKQDSTFRLLAGKYFYPGEHEFLLEVGLATVRYSETVPYESDVSTGTETVYNNTLGIPVRFAKYFNGKYVGFALTADVMYTKEEWITTAGFSVPFGKLRRF
ncbi:hypothetical protein [Agarivorans sp. Toyoura001]|uniref:hypothetical protein n=1 Tax=unclassified Agarivorans TaxID=2636026 RepID=UPI0010F0BFDB|nr:hypothetical protein [Agarivorans sp. Toyoura001]GDY25039.1 hypothetical protein AHAT_09290 [Agarivorans sp. Toyoura001]